MHAAIDQDAPAAFGFPDYVAAMAGLAPLDARPLSLRLCLPARVLDAGDAYLAYLMREAAMHAVLYTSLSTMRQLVFDGWGAAHLAQRQLVGLLAQLREHFRFMPGGVAQRMRQLCGDRLDMAGYTARGAVFARLPGATDGQPAVPAYDPGTHLVDCGLGASGRVAQLSWRNVADLQDYYARLDRNEIPLADGPVPDLVEHTQPYLMQVKEF